MNINPEDKTYSTYEYTMVFPWSNCCYDEYTINANHLQDAIEILIDYCKEKQIDISFEINDDLINDGNTYLGYYWPDKNQVTKKENN